MVRRQVDEIFFYYNTNNVRAMSLSTSKSQLYLSQSAVNASVQTGNIDDMPSQVDKMILELFGEENTLRVSTIHHIKRLLSTILRNFESLVKDMNIDLFSSITYPFHGRNNAGKIPDEQYKAYLLTWTVDRIRDLLQVNQVDTHIPSLDALLAASGKYGGQSYEQCVQERMISCMETLVEYCVNMDSNNSMADKMKQTWKEQSGPLQTQFNNLKESSVDLFSDLVWKNGPNLAYQIEVDSFLKRHDNEQTLEDLACLLSFS